MNPDHDRLTPACPTKSDRLAPKFALVTPHSLNFLGFFFAATFGIFEVAGYPFILPSLMGEFCAVFLERRDGIQTEFVVFGDEVRGPWHDHRGYRFV